MHRVHRNQNAVLLALNDPSIRSYLQRYPFATGPNEVLNELCRQAICENLTIRRREQATTQLRRLTRSQTQLTAEQSDRLERLMDEEMIPRSIRVRMIEDFGWEAALIPIETKDVLVIGCGDATEVVFLRAVLPDATITALDYRDEISSARKKSTGVKLIEGDLQVLLPLFGQEFDLVSSNHTLEHLYAPDEVLAAIAKLLRPNGALISTLPLEGMDNNPFLDRAKEVALKKAVHPLDCISMLDIRGRLTLRI